MSEANYWAHCRGVNGTKAVYKHFRCESDARIDGARRWEWEHPGEPLARLFVDCVETSYETTTQARWI